MTVCVWAKLASFRYFLISFRDTFCIESFCIQTLQTCNTWPSFHAYMSVCNHGIRLSGSIEIPLYRVGDYSCKMPKFHVHVENSWCILLVQRLSNNRAPFMHIVWLAGNGLVDKQQWVTCLYSQ